MQSGKVGLNLIQWAEEPLRASEGAFKIDRLESVCPILEGREIRLGRFLIGSQYGKITGVVQSGLTHVRDYGAGAA
jgi:hypothetical protein